jgi:hypothetical protein
MKTKTTDNHPIQTQILESRISQIQFSATIDKLLINTLPIKPAFAGNPLEAKECGNN